MQATLTRGEKWLFAALCVVVAISRVYALSTSQLDWDESLFAGGVHDYDVTKQHPHPPGYPLFIFFAKIVRPAVHSDFRALQAVAAIASFLLFPATFFLLRELGLRYRVAISGAILTAFLPTVWYYGGTACSDVPALAATIIACALLLAGRRHPRAWIAGMAVAGIAAGIRPLHVIIAVVPAIVAAVELRSKKTIVAGCALFAAIVFVSYFGAAMATTNPPWGYLHEIGVTAHHIGTVDSFNNVTRPPLRTLAPTFFIYAQRGGRAGLALLVLAAVGLTEAAIRRRSSVAILLAMFVPIAILSWMMLDVTAVTRYGLAYVMLYSVLAALGIDVIFRAMAPVVAIVLVVAMIYWTWPALELVRHQPSPPIAAMRWIKANVPPVGHRLYLDDSFEFHAWYELAGYDTRFFKTYDQIPPDAYMPGNYCIVDRPTIQPHARYFSFPRQRLAQVARNVYFEASIIPMNAMIRFEDGWYQDEWNAERTQAWKWMRQTSVTLLPPIESNGVLHLVFHLPLDALPRPPKVTIVWNGTVIDQEICKTLDNERRFVLPSRSGAPNECRILLDEVGRTPADPREFGLELFHISWERQ